MAKNKKVASRGRPLVLCDTNIMILLLRRRKLIADEIHAINESRILICPIITGEVYAGMLKRELRATKTVLRRFNNYPLDKLVSAMFEHMMYSYRDYHPKVADTLIAATAATSGAKLWTTNRNDFYFFQEINLYNPVYSHPPGEG